ncbi:isochorismate synthase [Corynebacterium lizhenjunii]|uniref:isochorismate synthase n=1 Tax=Corynebacterium lizhenjunii TaxID=2709394 RepID=A0A7T0KG25_9CORY|nr:isochorismate synthase [Corynebacterium lizhenjunii]QPK80060.1 isochorismate synthase [Corynebacterium lizhenjunii]
MHTSRPATAPDFLLSRSTGSVRTQGAQRTFTEVDDALAALRNGEAEMVVGALPFSRNAAAALTVPKRIIREDGPLEPHAYYRQARLGARVVGYDPQPEEHLERVEAAIATIENSALEKVVLARAVDIAFPEEVDPRFVAARLIDLSYHRDGFIADLSPAGREGAVLVGSSPEVLIKRQGSTVSAFPLAGSAARHPDKARDLIAGQDLLHSAKDLHEHAFVVNHLRSVLEPLCKRLDCPATPQLLKTNEMWHLGTPITGTLKDPTLPALELAVRVHPTPAICGTPTDAAEDVIAIAESDRGFYAGAVGWCDSSGDGEYMVAIRCAEVQGDRARAWAGGGIVAGSDAAAELAETSAKLRTILRALGIDASSAS